MCIRDSPQKIRRETRAAGEASGEAWVEHPSEAVVDWMIDDADRPGRKAGRGFYEYCLLYTSRCV